MSLLADKTQEVIRVQQEKIGALEIWQQKKLGELVGVVRRTTTREQNVPYRSTKPPLSGRSPESEYSTKMEDSKPPLPVRSPESGFFSNREEIKA
jgi:hypothetical protein